MLQRCRRELIIAEDIRSQVYETDEYPAPDGFLNDVNSFISKTLKCLVNTIVLKNKRGDLEKWEIKSTAICHAIISAARLKSFLSPLQIGLAVHRCQKYGSNIFL